MSELGRIVEDAWTRIPEHFGNTRTNVFQVMPNHLHGIVDIKEARRANTVIQTGGENDSAVRARHVVPLQKTNTGKFGKPRPGTLSAIIGSFKAAVTRQLRREGEYMELPVWHRNYYDHVVRDDVDRFFIEWYIELNPLLWNLDADNVALDENSIEVLRAKLQERYGLVGLALERVVDHEMNDRTWRERELVHWDSNPKRNSCNETFGNIKST